MRLEFRPNGRLPRLAWAACLERGRDAAIIHHGDDVETWSDGFVEGAWDAPFAAHAFDFAPVFAGSGGRLVGDRLRFAGPTNMYERLQSVRVDGRRWVSNSLALLLAASGQQLDPVHSHYYFDLLDALRSGTRRKRKLLRLAGGSSVELHDCCNIDVGRDLGVERREKEWGSAPASCDAYLMLLEDTMARVATNAGAPERERLRYRPIAMVSQGYDSAAVAALARKGGCREAVTFLRSHNFKDVRYDDDSGVAIAQALGYEVIRTFERNDGRQHPEFRAEEFYIETWGVDGGMVAMADHLCGALLLSGRSGEAVWTRGQRLWRGRPFLQYPIDRLAGCALGEIRMRLGFLHFPLPTIALIHARTIQRWNATRELDPWSIGGDYDKPIARRILEEAGVPRDLFGQAKMGGSERPAPVPPARPRRLPRWVIRARARFVERVVLYRIGNRLHPRWATGSFEIQRDIAKMIERYRDALELPAP